MVKVRTSESIHSMMFYHDGLRTFTAENARAAHITGHPLLILLLRPPFLLFFSLTLFSFRSYGGFILILRLFLAHTMIVSLLICLPQVVDETISKKYQLEAVYELRP